MKDADKQTEGQGTKLLEEARQTGDYSALGEWAADQVEAVAQQAAVDGQVSEGVNEKLAGFVEARYGDQIRGMTPEEVAKLDQMSLEDALETLEGQRAKAQGPAQEGLTMEERAAAIAHAKIAASDSDAENWAEMRRSIDEQVAGEEASMGPVVEEAEGEVE